MLPIAAISLAGQVLSRVEIGAADAEGALDGFCMAPDNTGSGSMDITSRG
jgi:hypothetical protein